MTGQESNPASRWYVRNGLSADPIGPYSGKQLVEFATEGRIDERWFVCSESATKNRWVKTTEIPKLVAAMDKFLERATKESQLRQLRFGQYSTQSATTMRIGGVLNILSSLAMLVLAIPFFGLTIPISVFLFVLAVFEFQCAGMAGNVSADEFRNRAQLIGILEIVGGFLGSCLCIPVGIMTLTSLPRAQ